MRWPLALATLGCAACLGMVGSSGRDPAADPQAIATPPVVRLTNVAYRNTMRDLFPRVTLPSLTLPPDNVVGDFDNDALAQAPTADVVRAYNENANLIATAVLANLDAVLPCASAALDESCARNYLIDLADRAFRRPLTDEERTRIGDGLRARITTLGGLRDALGVAVEGILQSPHLLYRVETGGTSETTPSVARLDAHELASRLSYFLWDSMPDAELRRVADDGSILDVAVLETQARRLIADPRAHATVAHMQEQWLRFDKMATLRKSATLFPAFDDLLAAAMRESVARFVEHTFWEEGTLEALLTDTHIFVNQPLAQLYGVAGVSGSAMQMTSADPAQRAGVLTQAGLLAAFAHETRESPVTRGVFVLDRLLCTPVPPPPPEVNNTPPEQMPGTPPTTTRELFEQQHHQGSCAGCHRIIDGVGFGFTHYDAIGRWRDTEAGKPVDATGNIIGTREIDGPFNGAVELGKKLSTSRTAQACATKKWVQYALSLDHSMLTEDVVIPLRGDFREGFDMRELLVRIAKSPTFRYRTLTPEARP
jgi:hypothetical protein